MILSKVIICSTVEDIYCCIVCSVVNTWVGSYWPNFHADIHDLRDILHSIRYLLHSFGTFKIICYYIVAIETPTLKCTYHELLSIDELSFQPQLLIDVQVDHFNLPLLHQIQSIWSSYDVSKAFSLILTFIFLLVFSSPFLLLQAAFTSLYFLYELFQHACTKNLSVFQPCRRLKEQSLRFCFFNRISNHVWENQ